MSATTSAIIGWLPNSEADVAGYHIYAGRASGVYDQSLTQTVLNTPGAALIVTFTGLEDGVQWFFAVAAFDTSDNEGELSDELSKINRYISLRAA